MLSWGESPWGGAALTLFAFAESSFFPIPPDVLLIALCLGRPDRALFFASLCTLGSLLGGLAGYGIGFAIFETLGRPILQLYGAVEQYEKVVQLYQTHSLWIIFTAAFTPIPYKVITITAGACAIPIVPFLAISAIGRGLRFFLVAFALRLLGEPAKHWIDRYFNRLTLAFTILLIGGFVVLKFFAR